MNETRGARRRRILAHYLAIVALIVLLGCALYLLIEPRPFHI